MAPNSALFRVLMAALGFLALALSVSMAHAQDRLGVLKAVATEIEKLKPDFPQLRDFSAATHLRAEPPSISYAFRTHAPAKTGGWTSGVPNPDADGIWFRIELYDPGSTLEIHTQPVTAARCLGDSRISFLMLEGRDTASLYGPLWSALAKQGARECDSPASPDVAYGEPQDRACAAQRGYEIKSEWVEELNRVLPEFRALWKAKGAAMFAAAASLTRRPMEAFAVPVRLTLCDTPSQSFGGPSVNMRFALRSFTATPVPLRYKVDTAFHESLHAFVVQHAPRDSRLVASHRSESTCVVNHLHLLALQKAVLLSMGEPDALAQVIANDSQLPSGCYKRAWALVNETEGTYRQYVDELSR